MKVFENDTYEQQRINIEALAKKYPNDWFYKSQMECPANQRTGFAPRNEICYVCKKNITEGERAITPESLNDDIILGCPYCYTSYCD